MPSNLNDMTKSQFDNLTRHDDLGISTIHVDGRTFVYLSDTLELLEEVESLEHDYLYTLRLGVMYLEALSRLSWVG